MPMDDTATTGGLTAPGQPVVTARQRYEALRGGREPFLQRAREAALLTLPGLLPPQGHTSASTLPQPFQALGADGVNTLASKLLLVLFPPGQPFFRLDIDETVLEQLRQQAGDDEQYTLARGQFDAALSRLERAVVARMETSGSRSENYEAIKHLIVTGNYLIQVMDDGAEKGYPLDRYVVQRDLAGQVLEIVVCESLARAALPERVRAMLKPEDGAPDKSGADKTVELFTWVRREPNGGFVVHQEVGDAVVPGSAGTYPKDRSAWLPLRWNTVAGESYGRGRCEEYIGDLQACESGAQSILEFGAAAAKLVFLVDESGTTSKRSLQDANSGDFIDGRPDDVRVLQVEKMADFSVLDRVVSRVEARLEKAFLLASSVQRNAERVTAEEIRTMIGELETALGGTYSVLSSEFQRPLVVRIMHQMAMRRELPALPDGVVSPRIITGLEGLGRATDLQRLDAFIGGLAQQFGPQAVATYINVGEYATRRAAALGLDVNGLTRSEQEVQAMQQQQMMQSMSEKLGPSVVGAAARGMELGAQAPPPPAA